MNPRLPVQELFPGSTDGPYLDTATVCLGNSRAAAVMSEAIDEWQRGRFDWRRGEAAAEECRELFAGIVGGSPEEVAVLGGASVAAGMVAEQLPEARPGESVVVPGIEFGSNYFPWLLLRERGYEVRRVEADDGRLEVERFERVIDGGTVLVATSLVQSSSGYRVDLKDLAAMAHEVGARLVVDGSQALGAVDFLVSEGVDAVFACDQKFLLGARGLGYLWVNRDWLASFRPLVAGWRAGAEPMASFYGPEMHLSSTGSRLEHAVGWFVALANREGLAILAGAGVPAVAAHVADLSARMRARIEDLGLGVLDTGPDPSPILTILVPDAGSVRDRLAGAGIRAAVRAGRLRVSVHLYNTSEDVDELVAAVR